MAKSKAAFIACVDPRIAKAHMEAFLKICKNELKGELADPIFSAGSVSSILTNDDFGAGISGNIYAAVNLHNIDTLVVVEHEDCGYYGLLAKTGIERFVTDKTNEKEAHAQNARAAVKILQERYPQIINVIYRYMYLDGTLEEL